jgi:hypothetical protein
METLSVDCDFFPFIARCRAYLVPLQNIRKLYAAVQ